MNVELTLTDLGNPADQRNLVVFRLDQQTYALPIEPIVQIIEMVTITPIPQVSDTVEGVINVRGVPILVVNLRRHLGLPEAALQLHTPIVLAQVGESMVGLIVDEVLDVLSLPGGQITRPADILLEGLGEAPIFQGLAHTPDGMMLLLLDLEHLFLPHQVQVLAQAVETLPEVVVEGASGEPPAETRPEVVVEEAFEDVGAALAAAPAEVEPKPDRKRHKKRWPTALQQAQDPKVSKETHLDGSDREVGT